MYVAPPIVVGACSMVMLLWLPVEYYTVLDVITHTPYQSLSELYVTTNTLPTAGKEAIWLVVITKSHMGLITCWNNSFQWFWCSGHVHIHGDEYDRILVQAGRHYVSRSGWWMAGGYMASGSELTVEVSRNLLIPQLYSRILIQLASYIFLRGPSVRTRYLRNKRLWEWTQKT